MKGHFEAKKHGWRQTQDGYVVSFVIHPQEIDAALAVAPFGTRYMLAFAEISDDDKPKDDDLRQSVTEATRPVPTKAPREWIALSPSQQAGIRCNEARFQKFIDAIDADAAADYVRLFCGVLSRSEIKPDTTAAVRWAHLERDYQAWLTTEKYEGVAR